VTRCSPLEAESRGLVTSLFVFKVVVRPFLLSSSIRRKIRADSIEQFGFSVMPCTRCKAKKVECKMLEGSRKCQTCTRLGRVCDSNGVPLLSLSRMVSEDRRLEKEEEEAEEAFLVQQAKLNESLARLTRLRRQRRLLRQKGERLAAEAAMADEVADRVDETAALAEEAETVFDINSLAYSDVCLAEDVDWLAVLSSAPVGGNQ
jgi:hypothetical protein